MLYNCLVPSLAIDSQVAVITQTLPLDTRPHLRMLGLGCCVQAPQSAADTSTRPWLYDLITYRPTSPPRDNSPTRMPYPHDRVSLSLAPFALLARG